MKAARRLKIMVVGVLVHVVGPLVPSVWWADALVAPRTLVGFARRTTFGSPGPRSAMLLRRPPMRLWTAMLTLLAECQGATDEDQGASHGRADFEYGHHSVSP